MRAKARQSPRADFGLKDTTSTSTQYYSFLNPKHRTTNTIRTTTNGCRLLLFGSSCCVFPMTVARDTSDEEEEEDPAEAEDPQRSSLLAANIMQQEHDDPNSCGNNNPHDDEPLSQPQVQERLSSFTAAPSPAAAARPVRPERSDAGPADHRPLIYSQHPRATARPVDAHVRGGVVFALRAETGLCLFQQQQQQYPA